MNLAILGGGESGVGAALLAKQHGYTVFVSEGGTLKRAFREQMEKNTIPFEEGGHTFERLDQADLIVKSPGIPDTADIVRRLGEQGHTLISEIEFGYRHCKGKILGVTGSNGKTTTTRICYSLFQEGFSKVRMAGNIGQSFCRALTEGDAEWWILELSSFQLEGIDTFRPEIAIFLNLTPDHLDRYGGSMQQYGTAKMRIAGNMVGNDFFIYNAGDQWIPTLMKEMGLKCETLPIGDANLVDGTTVHIGGRNISLPQRTLPGRHNQLNAACAIAAAMRAGVQPGQIANGLAAFTNAPHRLEFVAERDGVRYINDSKATNVDSVLVALDAMTGPVIWIAGGHDKGNDYAVIRNLVKEKVKALICLGADNTKLKEAFSTEVDSIQETTTAGEAVRLAASKARQGDVVLLSPACASFDLFDNYEHRGNAFKAAVKQMMEKQE